MEQQVLVYSQPGWAFCDKTKEFLSSKNIKYIDRNIADDESALKEFERLGYMTKPVTVIDGTAILGFNKAELMKALGL